MYATKPARFFVEWDSVEILTRLEEVARKNGTHTEDCDDWYEPYDIVDTDDDDGRCETLKRARVLAVRHLHDAHFGEVRIYERIGIEEVGAFWDCGDARLVETISP